MRKLRNYEIQEILKNNPLAQSGLVWLTLWSLRKNKDPATEKLNLIINAKQWRWNSQTIKAIEEGIAISAGQ